MKIKKRQLVRKKMTYISFILFPATFVYFSPYVIVDGSAKGIICGSFFMFSLLFLSALVLGRAFCGWLCALGGAQDILAPLSKKYVSKGNRIKWFLWTPWIVSIVVVAIRQGGYDSIDPCFIFDTGPYNSLSGFWNSYLRFPDPSHPDPGLYTDFLPAYRLYDDGSSLILTGMFLQIPGGSWCPEKAPN